MTINTDDLINSIMESLDRITYIDAKDIPSIDLYMDQVTTFMNSKLKSTTRNPKGDKILTKTMINNYAKNDLLPSPEKKKYSKEHILLLIIIYYLKGFLSFNDIQTVLKPITERYYKKDADFNLECIYNEIFELEKSQNELLKKDILEKFELAGTIFKGAPAEDEDFFQLLALISLLGFDVYVKKLLIEKLIDGFNDDHLENQEKGK